MNDVVEKIFSWRKSDNKDKSSTINNNTSIASNKYTQKEKEYINKYLNISKNFLREENLYNIIIKFNFNDQLILAEIFHLMDLSNETEKEKDSNENNENKSVFIPYKTKFGIMKSLYSLKKENKEKKCILCKEKKVYNYDNVYNGINNKNNLNMVNEDKDLSYIKRFSNFNKIIEDYQCKKFKNEKFKKKVFHKNYINNNYFNNYKYYNSKKYKYENNDSNNIQIQNKDLIIDRKNLIKENIINFEYKKEDLEVVEKDVNKTFSISEKIQISINPIQKENKKLKAINGNIKEKVNEIKILNNKNQKKDICFLYKNTNEENKNNININIKNNMNKNFIDNFNPKFHLNNNTNNNYISQNYNNIYNKTYFNNITYNNIYKNIYNNINMNNKNINSDNNVLLNQRVGIPLYFPLNNNNNIYPSYFNSNNIIMNKNNININNNCLMNIPHNITMHYQGFNNNINNIRINSNYNCIKYYNYKNTYNQINPMMYCLLMKKKGIKFIPNQILN